VDGSKQQYGIDYEETHAPVASWASIRLILLLSSLNKWHRGQIDFVQAFTQALVETDLYIEIPRGCDIGVEHNNKDWALKVLNNIYGQRQAGKVWYDHLTDGLINKMGFQQSKNDLCIL
jgi:Reverse transcriptase (RNA-dependent DNA polymerase)